MVDLPLQTRADVRLMPESVDAERRTVEVVWSTGAAVRRRDPWTGKRYDEVLSLEEAHVDLSRLNGGAPLLNTHGAWDLRDVIGVVERAWIAREGEALVGRATVRFSDRADVEPIWRDVASGIVRNVSVGYAVRSYEITETDGQPPVWRAVDWQPLELSAVPIGADAAAGFRAAGQPAQPPEPATHPCHLLRRTPAPIPEEPTMTREAETETTPPEAAAAAAPAATAPAEPTPARGGPRRGRGGADPRRRADGGACGRAVAGGAGAEPGRGARRGRARPGRGAAPHRHDPRRGAEARRRRLGRRRPRRPRHRRRRRPRGADRRGRGARRPGRRPGRMSASAGSTPARPGAPRSRRRCCTATTPAASRSPSRRASGAACR